MLKKDAFGIMLLYSTKQLNCACLWFEILFENYFVTEYFLMKSILNFTQD